MRVVGSAPEIGAWSPDGALPLQWSEGHTWSGAAQVAPGQQIEFKFLVWSEGGAPTWEPGANHTASVPDGGAVEVLVTAPRWGDAASVQIEVVSVTGAAANGTAPAAAPVAEPPAPVEPQPAAVAAAPAPDEQAAVPAPPAAPSGPSPEEAALRSEVLSLRQELLTWRQEAATLVATLDGVGGDLADGLGSLRSGQQQLARLVAAQLAADKDRRAKRRGARAAQLDGISRRSRGSARDDGEQDEGGAGAEDAAAATADEAAGGAEAASEVGAQLEAVEKKLLGALTGVQAQVERLAAAVTGDAPPTPQPGAKRRAAPADAEPDEAAAPGARLRRRSSQSVAPTAGAGKLPRSKGGSGAGSRGGSRRTSMAVDPDMALDEYLSANNVQSYFKGMAFAAIRALGAWQPGLERHIGGFSACWRDYKVRWGPDSIGEYKKNLTSAQKLLDGAAADAHLAAQLVWTVATLAEGSAQLRSALESAKVDVGAARVQELRASVAGGDEGGSWCSELFKGAPVGQKAGAGAASKDARAPW